MPSLKLSPRQYKELIKLGIMSADLQAMTSNSFRKKYPDIASAADRTGDRLTGVVWRKFHQTVYPERLQNKS